MRLHEIPGTDLRPSSICLGTADWTTRQGDDLDAIYSSFRASGGNCFDSAHCYAFWRDALGAPERALGELMRKNRDRQNVIICTKGCHLTGGARYPKPDFFMTPEMLASDIRESLERFGMESIDLYFLHRDDPRVGVDEILDALHEQRAAGRIRYYAASNWRPDRLDQADAYCRAKGYLPFCASQVLYNLGHMRKPLASDMVAMDDPQEAWYSRRQMPVFAYSATASGYFATGAKGGNYDTPLGEIRRQRCVALAAKMGATPNQIALAYLLHRPFAVIPITGTLKLEHLKDTIGADAIRLSPDQVKWLAAEDAITAPPAA